MNKENKKHYQRIYLDVGLIAIVVLSLLGYTYYSSSSMTHTYTPLIEIKLETTTAHLWFEKILSGDRYESMDNVWQHLGQADWYVLAILQGGESTQGLIIPVKDPDLRQEIQKLRDKLAAFRKLTEERFETHMTAVAGSDIDQRYDASFSEFLVLLDETE